MGIEIIYQDADIQQLLEDRRINKLMHMIWMSREDLQIAFDISTYQGQQGLFNWYASSAFREYGIEPGAFDFLTKSTERSAPSPKTGYYHLLMRMESRLARLARRLPNSVRSSGKSLWLRFLSMSVRSLSDACPQNAYSPRISNDSVEALGVPGANLIGYALAESGMGEHVRMSAASFASTNVGFNVVNFNHGVPSRQKASLDHGKLSTRNTYRTNIFHINADQLLNVYVTQGEKFFHNRFNVSYPFWELSKLPEEWILPLNLMDEVWAPTKFIQDTLSRALNKAVPHMPVSIELPEVKKRSRRYFGIPENSYAFFCTFDFFSYIHRKNPWAVVNAFRKAFPNGNENVTLVIKVMNGNEKDTGWRELKEISMNDKRITLINKTLTKDDLISLKLECDCYVSLHRAEGLGRGPMEAMLLGKPTIVTNYSGNTDYSKKDNSCLVDYSLIPVQEGQYLHYRGQVWADPDVEHAAWYMKRLVADVELGAHLGQTAKQFVSTNFSPAKCGEIYKQHLGKLGLI